jgi:hypothetical protein
MRNYLGFRQLLWRHPHEAVRNRLTSPEDIAGNSGNRCGPILVLNVIDVDYPTVVDVVVDNRHVPNVRDVDLSQVGRAVVIPRYKRVSRAEWKPSRKSNTAHTNTHRKAATTDEGDKRW